MVFEWNLDGMLEDIWVVIGWYLDGIVGVFVWYLDGISVVFG